jgi:hypothetical protein
MAASAAWGFIPDGLVAPDTTEHRKHNHAEPQSRRRCIVLSLCTSGCGISVRSRTDFRFVLAETAP